MALFLELLEQGLAKFRYILLRINNFIGTLWQVYFAKLFSFSKLLDRYILIEILRPFFIFLFFFIAIFVTTALRDSLGDLIAKDISIKYILLFFFSIIVEQLPIAIPIASLFAGILAANRLSNDLELIAMRSLGMSYVRLYFSFLFSGIILCFFMACITFYFAPLQGRERHIISERLANYESIAFIKDGSFFNKLVGIGDHVDIYAKNKIDSIFQNIYIHKWNITRTLSASRQMIFATKGELIERNNSSFRLANISVNIPAPELKKEKNSGLLDNTANGLAKKLRDKDIFDISSLVLSPKTKTNNKYKKYLRLKNGFAIELSSDGKTFQTTNFSKGFMDYELGSSLSRKKSFLIYPRTLSLAQLITIYNKINSGGLVLDPSTISSDQVAKPKRYIELASKSMLATLKGKSGRVISKLSPEAIYKKYRLYVPHDKDTPKKRREHFRKISAMTSVLVKKQAEILFLIHKNISATFAVLFFLMLALPLGATVKRGGKGASFSLALSVYLIYSMLDSGLETYYKKWQSYPILLSWLSEIFVLVMGFLALLMSQEVRQSITQLIRRIYALAPRLIVRG